MYIYSICKKVYLFCNGENFGKKIMIDLNPDSSYLGSTWGQHINKKIGFILICIMD